jgi:hypothetical protein
MLALALVLATISGPTWSTTITDEDVERRDLQELIRAAWTEGEAAERGITAEVDEPEERIALLQARLQDPVKQQAAQSVTPGDVEAYVAAHPRLEPEERRTRALTTRSRADARRALRALGKGLTWSSAAKRYGRLRTRTIVNRQRQSGFEQRVFKTNRATTTRYGTTVFRITRITPQRPAPRAVQRAQAWEILASEAQRRAVTAFEAELRAKWLPRTLCAPAVQAHPDCGNPPTVE